MAAVDYFKPYCRRCDDFYYVRDAVGQSIVCPRCSCPACHRLKRELPHQGGCICHENEKSALAVVQPGGQERSQGNE